MTTRRNAVRWRLTRRTFCAALLMHGCASRKPQLDSNASRQLFAFSLGRAREILRSGQSTLDGLVLELGGMRSLIGVVHDASTGDAVLVGRAGRGRPSVRLEDVVIAMRAVLVHKQWPLVSIDPTEETTRTGQQIVRMEGRVEDSTFGRDLLAADVALKRLALGTLNPQGVPLVSYFDLRAKEAQNTQPKIAGSSRLWFQVLDGAVEERADVFAIRRLAIGVQAETVRENQKAPVAQDAAADGFSAAATKSYDRLSALLPEIRRLRALYEAVAVAEAIRNLPSMDLSYWLNQHPISTVPTPREFSLEVRKEAIATTAGIQTLRVSGGIQLRSLTLRLREGDVTAMRDAVLLSRPSPTTLTWPVPLEGWGSHDAAAAGNVAPALADKLGSLLGWQLEPGGSGTTTYEPMSLSPDGSIIGEPLTDLDVSSPSYNFAQASSEAGNGTDAGTVLAPSEDRGGVSADIRLRDSDFGPIPLKK